MKKKTNSGMWSLRESKGVGSGCHKRTEGGTEWLLDGDMKELNVEE